MMKKLNLSVLFLFGLGLTGLQAQNIHEAIPASGGNASGSGGSASYSVGQVVYTTHTGSSGTVAQGVQQPYEISLITAIEEAKGISLSVSAYPNPATDFLQLIVESEDIKDLSYQLYDITGKLLQNEKITGSPTSIVMSQLVSSTYFVKVITNNKTIKTFKIIKN